jgi:hypothetical protein
MDGMGRSANTRSDHSIIPPGTHLIFTSSQGSVSISSSRDNSSQMKGHDKLLGSPITAILLRMDAPSGACNLEIRVLRGPHTGETGWTCDSATIEGTKIEATDFAL